MRGGARGARNGVVPGPSNGGVRDGFSLVELLFALVVFQVGILGVAGMILMAQRNLMRAEITARGVLEAQLVADSVRDAGTGGSGSAVHPWGEVSWRPAPGIPGGVRAVAFSNHGGDTVAVVTTWPRLGAVAGGPVPAGGAEGESAPSPAPSGPASAAGGGSP